MAGKLRPAPGTYFFFNLGCPKNLVDAERVAARLEDAGFREAPTPEAASVLVVTTCAFISTAMEESVDEILRVAAAKRKEQVLAVLGCLVSREGAPLERLLPEVDLFLNVREMESLPERLGRRHPARGVAGGTTSIPSTDRAAVSPSSAPTWRKLFTPAHIAFLKIADGCSNRCSYCMIPEIRGELESRSKADILAEASSLAAAGVKELVVVAQDTTAWYFDRLRRENLYDLLDSIAEAARFEWIRLMYLHPAHVDVERLVSCIRSGAICPYVDIPIQHVSDRVLERMGRPYNGRELRALFGRLRSSVEDLVIRTTVMTGFPGETEREFRELADFLEEMSFDHVGVFTFSPERGTEACRLGGGVSEEVARERKEELLDIQMDISHERLGARLGSDLRVLVDSALPSDERPAPSIEWSGRFFGQAYEVDGVTFVKGETPGAGSFVRARVIEAEAYDLVAEVAHG
jgi:ribosomal protein S12 methylthiotransferase